MSNCATAPASTHCTDHCPQTRLACSCTTTHSLPMASQANRSEKHCVECTCPALKAAPLEMKSVPSPPERVVVLPLLLLWLVDVLASIVPPPNVLVSEHLVRLGARTSKELKTRFGKRFGTRTWTLTTILTWPWTWPWTRHGYGQRRGRREQEYE